MKKKLFLIVIIFVIILIYYYIIQGMNHEEKNFEGYLYWGREGVFFSEKFDINSKQLIEPITWVSQDDKVKKELLPKSFIIGKGENVYDDIRVLKVNFLGYLYKNGPYGSEPGYPTQLKVIK